MSRLLPRIGIRRHALDQSISELQPQLLRLECKLPAISATEQQQQQQPMTMAYRGVLPFLVRLDLHIAARFYENDC